MDEVEQVRKAAQAFYDKMAAWEVLSLKLITAQDFASNERHDTLAKIFSEHLTKSAANRKPSRRDSMTFSDPPGFAKPMTKIEPGMPGAYLVYMATPEIVLQRHCFEYEDGAWRVDFMEVCYTSEPGVWTKWLDI